MPENSFQVLLHYVNMLMSNGIMCSGNFHKFQTVGFPQYFLLTSSTSTNLCHFCSVITFVWMVIYSVAERNVTSEILLSYAPTNSALHWVYLLGSTNILISDQTEQTENPLSHWYSNLLPELSMLTVGAILNTKQLALQMCQMVLHTNAGLFHWCYKHCLVQESFTVAEILLQLTNKQQIHR